MGMFTNPSHVGDRCRTTSLLHASYENQLQQKQKH
jgi:tRNA/tmRNA/rRNA uracil-C5-methylase (TrmA/RlmC/RlmD family)